LALKGVSYRWKNVPEGHNANATQVGFLADDVQKVFPDWVGSGPDGLKYVRSENLAALTIEAIRELAERVRSLTEENHKLIRRVDRLEKAKQKKS
jgi:hypothetical protein